MIERIKKRINTSPRRAKNLYNNIIAGIITGATIGSLIPLIKKPFTEGCVVN
jgi:hypothetical protein